MPGTIKLTNHKHNANFCFCHVTPGTNTLKMKIDVIFKVRPGTITLSNNVYNANFCFCHMHNANCCFCHVTPGTNTPKSYIQ